MQPQAMGAQLQEQDYMNEILLFLKHQVLEYATAVMEASSIQVRQTMQRLLNETLTEQADCYQLMARQGWYPPAPTANRQDLLKSIQQHRQDAQKNMQIARNVGIGMQNQTQIGSWQQQVPAWQTGQMRQQQGNQQSQQNVQQMQQPWQAAQPWQYTQNWQDPSQQFNWQQQNQSRQPWQ
ncbi:spore coat protein [Sulfoacidibacillus thermotolerans]|uniref:Spore coat protein n=1 Tax=Sulfoacidibacillus thermotolerans TaxID=1765684 RepID=A0A2U3DAN0_SULT2|nr:spore coat protein [Sulfoacidibacillus thermotolerans]PWI58312.1 hypothetical protein BM613_03555 [Sulfoacidibacillus thermotolerans]